jgi:starch phosphorylase
MGYRVKNCNFLRLWKSDASDSFDLSSFNVGDYYNAVDAQVKSGIFAKFFIPTMKISMAKNYASNNSISLCLVRYRI